MGEWPGNCLIMRPVLLLALDTSSPAGSVAALRDGKVVGLVSTWTDEDYSSRMFRHVELLLRELSLDLGQFDAFAVASGPGSFTGLRVGLTAVKGWAEIHGRPIVAVSVLEAIAAQSRGGAPTLVPVVDARRGEVYFGVYRRQGGAASTRLEPAGGACVATPEDFWAGLEARVGNSTFTVVTPTPEAIAGAADRAKQAGVAVGQMAIEMVANVLAPTIAELALRGMARGDAQDSLTLDADYVRRTDAELKWKDPSN